MFRGSTLSHDPTMATLKEKIDAERAARELFEKADLPQPDAVEYGHTCIRLFWAEPKTCVIVEIDEPPEGSDHPVDRAQA